MSTKLSQIVHNIYMTRFKHEIEDEILSSGMPKQDIADALSVDPSLIYQWMKGVCEPSLDTFHDLCVLLNISADELLKLDDPQSVAETKVRLDLALKQAKEKRQQQRLAHKAKKK